MRISRALLGFVIALSASPSLAAGGDKNFVGVALSYTQDVAVADDDEYVDETTVINATIGIGMGSGLVLGGKYFDYSKDDAFLDNDDRTVISGWGPLIGYFHQSGFFVAGSYLVQPTKEYKSSGTKVSYEGGNGYVLDLGKTWPIGSSFAAGLQLTQSKVQYKEQTVSGDSTDLDNEWSDSSLYPYVNVFVYF